MLTRLIGLCLLLPLCYGALAQDKEDCQDHPLFSRMPKFLIEDCSENFNSLEIQTGEGKKQSIEGNITYLKFAFGEEGKMPSPLQIIRNYEKAVLDNGGKKIYSGTDELGGGTLSGTYSIIHDGKELWITIRSMYEPQTAGEVGAYELYILEKAAMTQDIEANVLFRELEQKGSVPLYILFETGKSAIRPESEKIIGELARMLADHPTLKVSIEGHTDNTGSAADNRTLSEARARAVLQAVVAKGVAANRLSARGWGQDKPVADNTSETGRARNRRVEIVRQ